MQKDKELLEEIRVATNTKLTREERETLYSYCEADAEWHCDTTIVKHMNRLKKQNWIKIGEQRYPNGEIMAMQFKAPYNCLSPRSYVVNKPKRKRAPMTEEHKAKLLAGRKNKTNNN